jgi:hypothetical protein
MKNRIFLTFSGIAFVFAPAGALAKSDIPTPIERAKILSDGERSLASRDYQYDLSAKTVPNPFIGKQVDKPKVVVKSLRPSSDAEFLAVLASKLNPTGVLMLGDNQFLLFGEKKVKVGDTINIPFDKESVSVELIDLTGTSFTLKLNNEQLTRPITPANSHEKPSS